MINLLYTLSLLFIFSITSTQVNAEDIKVKEKQLTTINLKHISGDDVVSVLKSLIDKSVSISTKNNTLLINGAADKIKNILPIIDKIDTLPAALTIEFIASNRKVNFKQSKNTYQSGKNRSNTSQSMSIIERQWVNLKTGLSIPISERKRYADGTETQSFRYKKISKSYLFKVHEFSGWSVIQVGLNESYLSDNIAGAIEHTELDTTIIGKTGEWLEVASSKRILNDDNSQVYSTTPRDNHHIYLYVKVIKPEPKSEIKIIK